MIIAIIQQCDRLGAISSIQAVLIGCRGKSDA